MDFILISLRKCCSCTMLFFLSSFNASAQELWTWGRNFNGQLGIGNNQDIVKQYPEQVGNYNSWQMVRISGNHAAAIRADHTIWTWGNNTYGQFGNGTNTWSNVPVQSNSDMDWAYVEAGSAFTAAIKNDGTLWTWGENANGALGLGNNINTNVPSQVGSDANWVLINSKNSGFSVALKTDGTLWAWGMNSSGQLGNGTNVNSNTPLQIGADTDWQYACANNSQTIALKTNGTVWYCGQFGTSTMQQLGLDTDWAQISQGGTHVLALKQDGSLWAWGGSLYGVLGTGIGAVFTMVPTRIGTDVDWMYADAGSYSSMALKNDGSLWAWGSNVVGQAGCHPDSQLLSVPHKIAEAGSFQTVSAGFYATFALGSNVQLNVPLLQNNNESYKLDAFPNPNTGNFAISLNMPSGQPIDMQLLSITGQVIHRQSIITTPLQVYPVKAKEKLARGTYFVRLKSPVIDRSIKIEVQ